jgi:hypothetical protein
MTAPEAARLEARLRALGLSCPPGTLQPLRMPRQAAQDAPTMTGWARRYYANAVMRVR